MTEMSVCVVYYENTYTHIPISPERFYSTQFENKNTTLFTERVFGFGSKTSRLPEGWTDPESHLWIGKTGI